MPHIHKKIDFVSSGYIVHQDKVLLLFHKKLQSWLPPGGHIELDEDPIQALFKEIEEETGINEKDLTLIHTSKPEEKIFEDPRNRSLHPPTFMNIHHITDEHQHIDLEYILESKTDKIKINKKESEDLRWFTKKELNDPKLNIWRNARYYANFVLDNIPQK